MTPEVEETLSGIREEAEELSRFLRETPDLPDWLARSDVHHRWLLLRLRVHTLEALFERIARGE